MRSRFAALALGFAWLAVVAAGCGSDGKRATTTSAARTAAPATPPECHRVAAPKPRPVEKLPAPNVRLDPARSWQAVVDTSCGTFTIALDVKDSPKTTGSFAYLARRGFYDGLTFHRVVSGFVIQGGDPAGNGTGGPGYKVVEPPPAGTRYTRGVVAMAKAESEPPGTSGSQFYVVTGEDAQLPPDYALLGRVSAGQEVVDAIGVVPTNSGTSNPALQDRPLMPVVIRKVTIR